MSGWHGTFTWPYCLTTFRGMLLGHAATRSSICEAMLSLISTCDPSLLPARPLSPSAFFPLCSAVSRFLQKAALALPISGPNPSQRPSCLPSSHRFNISFPSGSPA